MNVKEGTTTKDRGMSSSKALPAAGVELRTLLVARNYPRSLAFYRDGLGATVVREFPGTLCFLSFAGSQVLLTVPGGPTKDKPTVTFAPPTDPDRVTSELAIRVPDCYAAYEVLRARGAEFLTPPVDWGYELRAFFRDPDGHLLELSQSGQQKN